MPSLDWYNPDPIPYFKYYMKQGVYNSIGSLRSREQLTNIAYARRECGNIVLEEGKGSFMYVLYSIYIPPFLQ